MKTLILQIIESTFLDVLNKHAPLKRKCAKAYHGPFMVKALRETITCGFQLECKYLKTKTQKSFKIKKKLLLHKKAAQNKLHNKQKV